MARGHAPATAAPVPGGSPHAANASAAAGARATRITIERAGGIRIRIRTGMEAGTALGRVGAIAIERARRADMLASP
jgi:hypothetical protein